MKRISFLRSDPRRRDNASSVFVICAVDLLGTIYKDVIGDKKKMQTQEKFLEAMQESGAFAQFARLEPEKDNLTA